MRRLKKFGLAQVGRMTLGKDSSVYIGRPEEVCFPYQFACHTLWAPPGEEDFWLDPEEIAALLRRFKISQDEFNATA
ncbi:MAG: hypothetical protein U0Q16_09240 [Bryobacteraceae bacterium]